MATTENFFTRPADVLKGAADRGPACVVVITMDDHGSFDVFGSHSAPITMSMIRAAIPHIDGLNKIEEAA